MVIKSLNWIVYLVLILLAIIGWIELSSDLYLEKKLHLALLSCLHLKVKEHTFGSFKSEMHLKMKPLYPMFWQGIWPITSFSLCSWNHCSIFVVPEKEIYPVIYHLGRGSHMFPDTLTYVGLAIWQQSWIWCRWSSFRILPFFYVATYIEMKQFLGSLVLSTVSRKLSTDFSCTSGKLACLF